MQVAGAGGVHENGPGDVAVQLGAESLLTGIPDNAAPNQKIAYEAAQKQRIGLAQHTHGEGAGVVVLVVQHTSQIIVDILIHVIAVQSFHNTQYGGQIAFRVAAYEIHGLVQRAQSQFLLEAEFHEPLLFTPVFRRHRLPP